MSNEFDWFFCEPPEGDYLEDFAEFESLPFIDDYCFEFDPFCRLLGDLSLFCCGMKP